MAYALQQLINGVTLGMIYGLIAVGYTMVYGIIGMINFAHGDIFMVGAFLSLIALLGLAALGITSVPLALALTLVFAAGIAALYGWTVERVAYRPLRGSFRLAPLISAIGMSITLQNFVQVSQGARVKPIDAMHPRRHPADGPGRLRRRSCPGCRSPSSSPRCTILAIFTWLVTQDPARPHHARLRAGPEDGQPAGHRHRPHDQPDLRHRRRAGRRRRASCSCCTTA